MGYSQDFVEGQWSPILSPFFSHAREDIEIASLMLSFCEFILDKDLTVNILDMHCQV